MRFTSLSILGLAPVVAVIGILGAPVFEVASIKPNPACGWPGRGSAGRNSPGRMTLECAELRDLILTAYGIYANEGTPDPRGFRMQVLGGPRWIDSDRYDIVAKAEGNPPAAQIYGPMLRALLEDRFRLKVHREMKQAPVYLLTVAKGGAKLKLTKPETCTRPGVCGSPVTDPDGTFDMYGATMESLCVQLGLRLDRDVIDKTGITGMFDIHLEVSPVDLALQALAGGERAQIDPPAHIFTALQQQLGLKLVSARGPVEFLVIDHIEKASM